MASTGSAGSFTLHCTSRRESFTHRLLHSASRGLLVAITRPSPSFSSLPYDLSSAMASGDEVPPPMHYPPDINCTLSEWQDPELVKSLDCSVTDSVVSFLNLTGSNIDRYLAAYCSNPPEDDGCPYGPCPNPDIAGPLVRIASESTHAFRGSEPRY